jgi:hypothetical protein
MPKTNARRQAGIRLSGTRSSVPGSEAAGDRDPAAETDSASGRSGRFSMFAAIAGMTTDAYQTPASGQELHVLPLLAVPKV